jgi:hypothetical protein
MISPISQSGMAVTKTTGSGSSRRGPPFDIQVLGLERHHVFVSEREVVFFFEGDSAAAAVDALSRSRRVLNVAVRWRGIVGGRPRLAEERFRWTRTI